MPTSVVWNTAYSIQVSDFTRKINNFLYFTIACKLCLIMHLIIRGLISMHLLILKIFSLFTPHLVVSSSSFQLKPSMLLAYFNPGVACCCQADNPVGCYAPGCAIRWSIAFHRSSEKHRPNPSVQNLEAGGQVEILAKDMLLRQRCSARTGLKSL